MYSHSVRILDVASNIQLFFCLTDPQHAEAVSPLLKAPPTAPISNFLALVQQLKYCRKKLKLVKCDIEVRVWRALLERLHVPS